MKSAAGLYAQTRATYGDGVFGGGPCQAAEAVMETLFEAGLGDVVEQLKFG